MPNIGFQLSRDAAKRMFFDRKAVIRMLDRKTLAYLRRVGGFVRLTSRRSIRRAPRRGNKTSAPGNPPLSHTGLLRENIFFGLEPTNRSVVIGPAKLNGRSGNNAPEVLEHGGTTVIETFERAENGAPTGRRRRRVTIKKRPYMQPALELAAQPQRTRQFWEEAARRA